MMMAAGDQPVGTVARCSPWSAAVIWSNDQAEREHILAAARETLLSALPGAWAIYVFGSFACGEWWALSRYG